MLSGKEFFNKQTLAVLKKYKIKYFSVYSDKKNAIIGESKFIISASYILYNEAPLPRHHHHQLTFFSSTERYNRTQKTKLFRYFTQKGTHRWIDVIDKITNNYNNTIHRSTKFAPSKVTKLNANEVRKNLYPTPKSSPLRKAKFRVGQTVRLALKESVFAKGYTKNWTEEIFYIEKVKDTNPITYTVSALGGDEILGSFYEKELNLVNKKDEIYPIDRILKKRKTARGLELYVSWKGYSSDFNSWILEKDLYPISNA